MDQVQSSPRVVPNTMSLMELLEVAISSQELGTVNFNVLRILLAALIGKHQKCCGDDPVKLDDHAAHQIANYNNYMKGEPVTPMPGILRVSNASRDLSPGEHERRHSHKKMSHRTQGSMKALRDDFSDTDEDEGGTTSGKDGDTKTVDEQRGDTTNTTKSDSPKRTDSVMSQDAEYHDSVIMKGQTAADVANDLDKDEAFYDGMVHRMTHHGDPDASAFAKAERDRRSRERRRKRKQKQSGLEDSTTPRGTLTGQLQDTMAEDHGLSVNDMWQIVQLHNRIAAAEAAIQKMASLIEDLAREMGRLRWDAETTQAVEQDVIQTIEGDERCLGPGICKGHGMPAGIAVCQFSDQIDSALKDRISFAQDDSCPVCGGSQGPGVGPGTGRNAIRNSALQTLRPPREDAASQAQGGDLRSDASSSFIPPIRMGGFGEKAKEELFLPLEADAKQGKLKLDLENLRDLNTDFVYSEFDEKDVLLRLFTLWEAVKLLNMNDEGLGKRLAEDGPKTGRPKGVKMAGFADDFTDLNPSSAPVPPPLTSPSDATQGHHHHHHQQQGQPGPAQVSGTPPQTEEGNKSDKDDEAKETEAVDPEDIQTLFTNLANVIAECAEQKERIDQLVDAVRIIEAGMVTKHYMQDVISEKADKGLINTKVSYDEFGNTVDELHAQLHNLMVEGFQRNENWKKVTSELADELTEKLDKIELVPIRAFFKSRLRKVEDRVAALAAFVEEPDPAGTRKHLKDYNCISCDRKVAISGITSSTPLHCISPAPAAPSKASHRAYDLHRLRAQRTQLCDPDAREAEFIRRKMQEERDRNRGIRPSGNTRDMMGIVNKYVGRPSDQGQAVETLPPLVDETGGQGGFVQVEEEEEMEPEITAVVQAQQPEGEEEEEEEEENEEEMEDMQMMEEMAQEWNYGREE